MKKFLVSIIAGIILVWLFVPFFKTQSDKKGSLNKRQRGAKMAVAVEASPIQIENIKDIGNFTGTLIAKSKFDVVPKISGRIKKLFVDIGNEITKGDVIAQLDDEEEILALKQAEADLQIARANFNETSSLLEIAQKNLSRAEKMRKQKIVSDVYLEQAQAAYKTSEAKHKVSKAQLSNKMAALEAAKIKLSYAKVDVSWTEGSNKRFVAEKFLDEGAMAGPNSSIVTIIDIATLTAVIDVVEKDYFKIKIGQEALVESESNPEKIFPARVSRIAPILDDASRLARVELEMPNSGFQLKPGMFITTNITFAEHKSANVVPASSVVRRNEKLGVFHILENTTAKFIPIKTGIITEETIEILAPKMSGQVVSLGHHLLQDGAKVILPNLTEEKTHKGGKK